MKLSIVIVNYNVAYFLEQCLLSVFESIDFMQSKNNTHLSEVFVVDNNSVDNSVDMVSKKFPNVHCIANKENLGFSKANNQAIQLCTGEYILLLNPDTLVQKDTFHSVVSFMDENQDAGGLGVKMIDGRGNFLPESKRGLPTPWVAFYKIFGLSTFFPNSKRFGKYHLGYLDKNQNHEVDVLSGAFMLLRKKTLDKIGLLDETFFMYGEDIDLSYRIIKGGYKNYYFSNTQIIHYKGESTKKSSANYVFVFYNAMIIFAKKHFSQKNAGIFSFLIHLAIYLRASIALIIRIVKKMFLPLIDVGLMFICMFLLKTYWENNHKYIEGGSYPTIFIAAVMPSYILIWLTSLFINKAYKKPYKIQPIISGVFWGTVFILVVYALLDDSLRFSRALILLGAFTSMFALILSRFVANLILYKSINVDSKLSKRIIIAGSYSECIRVEGLIRTSQIQPNIIGYITGEKVEKSIGQLHQLSEIIKIYQVQEVIFCSESISADQIMKYMSDSELEVEYKIAPKESEFIIGSNSIHTNGELYTVDLNSIQKKSNLYQKRRVDMITSLLVLLFYPFLVWFFVRKNILLNAFQVLFNKLSWVGYTNTMNSLPKIKKGVFSTIQGIVSKELNDKMVEQLDVLYAKDYQWKTDVKIILSGLFKK